MSDHNSDAFPAPNVDKTHLAKVDRTVSARMIEDAYRALTPTTPEPIRALVLELAGRIA